MPAKCGGCGKFVSSSDTTRCTKCSGVYHRLCAGLPAKSNSATIGQCPECRKNKAETPVPPASVVMSTPPAVGVPTGVAGLAQSTTLQSAATPPSSVLLALENSDLAASQDVASALKLVVEEIRTLRFEVVELRKDVAELKASNDSCHTRMNGIESRLEALEKSHEEGTGSSAAIGVVESVVLQLQRDLNDRDQELMANDLVIANIPETQAENPTHLFQLIATKLGVTLDERDVVSAERVGGRRIKATSPTVSTEPRPRTIMVRLARRDQRDAVLNGARVRRGATTENLGIAGKPVRFFVNERLTRRNQQLFRQARAAAEVHGWSFVWSKRGRVLVRNKPGHTTHRIVSEEDIQRLIGPHTDTIN